MARARYPPTPNAQLPPNPGPLPHSNPAAMQVRTRIYVRSMARDSAAISRAHGEVFGAIRPASTMVEVQRLVHDDILVLIEADAVVV